MAKALEKMQKEYDASQSALVQLKKEREDVNFVQTKAESQQK